MSILSLLYECILTVFIKNEIKTNGEGNADQKEGK